MLFAPAPTDEWVALDLETTGLDPSRDQILSIAAVPARGRLMRLSERLDVIVCSDSTRITEAIAHHRLRPDDIAAGIPLDTALDALLSMVGSRPLVGYCIDFDFAMLDRALRPRLGFGLPNQRIDVQRQFAQLQRRRQPEIEPDLRFEAIANALQLPMPDRHSALGDAVAAGLMHIAMRASECGAPKVIGRDF